MSDESFVHTGFRLPRKMRDQVATVAKRYDVDRSNVHRWALKALFDYLKRHKGNIVLPLDFDAEWQKKKDG